MANMKALQDRIQAEGRNLGSGILKIDSLLNHQIYPELIQDHLNKVQSEFIPVTVDGIIHGILVNDFFQVTDDEARQDLEQMRIFRCDQLFHIDKIPGYCN